MPFTPAHVAAAFPFRRSRLIWSALIVGTIAPDLEYFIRLSPGGGYSHTLAGSFVLTLPLAILTLWLFHAFVKAAFVELLPHGFRCRLVNVVGEFRFGGAARFAVIVASLMIGILTHLVWDSFTHSNTWLCRTWPPLRHPVGVWFIGAMPVYKLLQYASTIVGLTVLLIWIAAWYRNTEVCNPRQGDPQNAWPLRKIMTLVAIAAIALLGAIFRALAAPGVRSNHIVSGRFAGPLVVTMIALIWWQLVLLGILRSKTTTETRRQSFC